MLRTSDLSTRSFLALRSKRTKLYRVDGLRGCHLVRSSPPRRKHPPVVSSSCPKVDAEAILRALVADELSGRRLLLYLMTGVMGGASIRTCILLLA